MANFISSIFILRFFLAFLCFSSYCVSFGNSRVQVPETAHFVKANSGPPAAADHGSLDPTNLSGANQRDAVATVVVTNRWAGVKKEDMPSEEQLLKWETERVRSIGAHLAARNAVHVDSAATLPSQYGNSVGAPSYVAQVQLGQQKLVQHLAIDSGSYYTWVQCKNCEVCFEQKDPKFDPDHSTPIICKTAECPVCEQHPSPGSKCPFDIDYADGSTVKGHLYRDTLTLEEEVVKDFKFGCAMSATEPSDRKTLFGMAGVMGLHKDKDKQRSVIDQAAQFGQHFSYCLPTGKNEGHLTFGQVNQRGLDEVTSTEIVSEMEYMVNLEAISIGDKKLDIPAKEFSNPALIDSGSTWSWLPEAAFQAVRTEFDIQTKATKGNHVVDAPQKDKSFLCYESVTPTTPFPKIKLHFKNGKRPLELADEGVMFGRLPKKCLQFKPNTGTNDPIIIGARAQQKYNVTFDVNNKRIYFVPGACP